MKAISERDLAVLIPLLAAKIRDLALELRASEARGDDLTDEEAEDQMQLQEMLLQYDNILDALRAEHEAGLAEGIQLPTFENLVRPFHIEST